MYGTFKITIVEDDRVKSRIFAKDKFENILRSLLQVVKKKYKKLQSHLELFKRRLR